MTTGGGMDVWKCCGCGEEAPDKMPLCDCPTGILYRKEGKPKMISKIRTCINHKKRPVRETLDGDELCIECCIKWAENEGRKVTESA